jgi:hypothetical protein
LSNDCSLIFLIMFTQSCIKPWWASTINIPCFHYNKNMFTSPSHHDQDDSRIISTWLTLVTLFVLTNPKLTMSNIWLSFKKKFKMNIATNTWTVANSCGDHSVDLMTITRKWPWCATMYDYCD